MLKSAAESAACVLPNNSRKAAHLGFGQVPSLSDSVGDGGPVMGPCSALAPATLSARHPSWMAERDAIYHQVMAKGRSAERQAFVQHYGDTVLDASLLKMPQVGFVAPDDPMWRSTLLAMDSELVSDSLVYRYNPSASPDGLRGSEGTFPLCTFLYVDALARAGRVDEARLTFEKMLTYANHLGLYSKEIAINGEQIGNFAQAFTYLALIDAAITLNECLDDAKNKPHRYGRRVGRAAR
jgi:GH15 family glucan-1,4-alpha-glucosidase